MECPPSSGSYNPPPAGAVCRLSQCWVRCIPGGPAKVASRISRARFSVPVTVTAHSKRLPSGLRRSPCRHDTEGEMTLIRGQQRPLGLPLKHVIT